VTARESKLFYYSADIRLITAVTVYVSQTSRIQHFTSISLYLMWRARTHDTAVFDYVYEQQ